MEWLKFVIITTLCSLCCIAYGTEIEAPEQIVRSISQDVLGLIDRYDRDPTLADQVDRRIGPLVDYPRMTAMATGRAWRDATPNQQASLIKEFRQMLARTYLSALTIYKNAKVDVKNTVPGNASDEQVVRTEVKLPNNQRPVQVDFSFERVASGWKAYDITVDGISFITSNRNQFTSTIQREGLDGLIKQLSDRNHAARHTNVVASK